MNFLESKSMSFRSLRCFYASTPVRPRLVGYATGRLSLRSLLGAGSAALLLHVFSVPSARALTFGDGDSASNPFYFSGESPSSSWSLTLDGVAQSSWAGGDGCDPNNTPPCVTLLGSSDVVIASSGVLNSLTAWTSGSVSSTYSISFAWAFSDLGSGIPSSPFYVINGDRIDLLGTSGSISSATLDIGSTLGFGVYDVDGYGDLTISGFSAAPVTPVPAPLPILGAGVAFGWIRKRRHQLKKRQMRS